MNLKNLPWNCNANVLKKIASKFGKVTEVNIPKGKNGAQKGFGFMQMETMGGANSVIRGMNGRKILGRAIAVDWALSKTHFNIHNQRDSPLTHTGQS